jgi:hypothetical protein
MARRRFSTKLEGLRAAKRTTVDGFSFPSRREASRYVDLKVLQACGIIRDLQLQKRYELRVCGDLVATYTADFVYYDVKAKQVIVEDSKGVRTAVYKLKRKLMRALYGISILET